MRTFLLIWSPMDGKSRESGRMLLSEKNLARVRLGKRFKDNWSTGATTSIVPGDRLFFLRLGKEPRGLFGSATARSTVYTGRDWRGGSGRRNYVEIWVDALVDGTKGEVLPLSSLQAGRLKTINWRPRASGTEIKDRAAARELERVWQRFFKTGRLDQNLHSRMVPTIDTADLYPEGQPKLVQHTKRERNQKLRADSKVYWKGELGGRLKCLACGFDFGKQYGLDGDGCIVMHHERGMAGMSRRVHRRIIDLVPLCPNCHAVVHRNPSEILSIEELKKLIANKHRH